MEFLILGPLEVHDGEKTVRLGAAKQRALLGVLLLHANETVSTARLVDELWGERPPATAENLVQGYVYALRKQLGDGVVETRAPGYRLGVDPGSLDLLEFERLVEEARTAPVAHSIELRRRALALWRGQPLADVALEGPERHSLGRLSEQRLTTQIERIDAEVQLGRHTHVLGELEALVAEHPYQERAAALLMLALYRSGRQADALEVYRTVRGRLSDELGLQPGKELRDLEAGILRQDEALSPARPVPAAEPDQPPPSRRLSRRAVIAGGFGGLAAVALGGGVTAFRSRASGGTQIHPGSVGVVDPGTRRIVDEIAVGFSSPLIAAGEGAVWLVDRNGRTLTGIDPKTKDVVLARQSISVEGVPTGLAAGEGSVWIALVEGHVLSLLMMEPELGTLRQRIVLEKRGPREPPFSVFIASVTLTVGEGAVWALERGLARVRRIDPATKVPALFAMDVGASSSVAVDGDAVWLGGREGVVTKLDLGDGYELGRASAPQVLGSATTSIAVDGEAVWFVGDSSTQLWRIDPLNVSIQDSTEIGESPSALAVGEDGAVWVAGRSATSLWRLDPKTNDLETIPVGATSGGLVAKYDRIWTSPGAAAG